MTLGNTPKRLTNIFLEKNKSFALNVRFKNKDGSPFDTTDAEIRLSADQPKYWGAAQVITLVADHLDDPAGLVQFKFQAADTSLEDGEYPYDVTMLSVREYSTPLLKGVIVIGLNTDEINDNVFTEVHPSDELVVLFGTSCDVEITLSQVDGLVGPKGETGDKGDPTGVFIQPDEPPPDAIPPVFPLWVDTDAEYHHSGYVYEAPEPDPDMPTGVLYFDNDETVIPPDGVGVLYVKDQNGDLIPVTRYGPPGPDGPPGVGVIVQTEPPDPVALPEGTMWVDEDSSVDPGGSGGGGLDQTAADARYVNVSGDLITGDLTVQGEVDISGDLIATTLQTNSVELYLPPTIPAHAASKAYVDAAAGGGLPVIVVATPNLLPTVAAAAHKFYWLTSSGELLYSNGTSWRLVPLIATDPYIQPYNVEVMTDTPLMYLRLGDTGTTAADASGNNRTGTYFGTYTQNQVGLVPDDLNKATKFQTSGYVFVPYGSWMNPASGRLTLEAIIRPDYVGNSNMIITRYNVGVLARNQAAIWVDTGMFYARMYIGGVAVTVNSNIAISVGGTYHVACTYDGVALRTYVNGAPGATAAATGVLQAPTVAGYFVAAWEDAADSPHGSSRFNGVIDEVAVYGSALSAARILTHYQAAGIV